MKLSEALKKLATKYRPRSQVKYMVPFNHHFYDWNIRHGNICDSYFDHIRVDGGHLDHVNVRECTFRGGIFQEVTFEYPGFSSTIFFNTVFRDCCFLIGLGMNDGTFIDCGFDNCEFSGNISLFESSIPSCTFIECTFDDELTFYKNLEVSFDECENVPYIPMTCPEEDAFFGYKLATFIHRVTGETIDGIVTVYIPRDAKRSSAYGRKCRCNKATVIGIERRNGEKLDDGAYDIRSRHDPSFIYHVDDTIIIDDFEEDRWEECAPGFHFFINKEEARRYG